MATTNLNLGDRWEAFIESEVSCGRYGSPTEVVRDALRQMEARQRTLEALRTHLAEGETQALRGDFVQDYSVEAILASSEQQA